MSIRPSTHLSAHVHPLIRSSVCPSVHTASIHLHVRTFSKALLYSVRSTNGGSALGELTAERNTDRKPPEPHEAPGSELLPACPRLGGPGSHEDAHTRPGEQATVYTVDPSFPGRLNM